MKRKLRLLLLSSAGLAVVVGLLLWWSQPRTTMFQGKSVKTWLLQLSAPDPTAHSEAESALAALGTNAIPDLVHLLHADDPSLRTLLWNHKVRLPRPLLRFARERVGAPQAYLIHPAAARALAKLGPDAAAAKADLVQALQDKVNGTYWEAGTALGRIGKAAVPDLILALRDQDTLVRCAAAHGLGIAGPDAASAVPALTELLQHGTANEQQIAAQSLAKIIPAHRQRPAR